MKEIPENIKRKIAALRRMAADTSSENEAMIAATQLQKLLAKYGLEGYDLELDGHAKGTEVFTIPSTMVAPWAGIVAQAVAQLYFCTVTQTKTFPGKDGKMCREFGVHGSNNYRSVARFMVETILNLTHAAACASSKAAVARGEYAGRGHIVSFRNGAAMRISLRCAELIRKASVGEWSDEEGNKLPAMLPLYQQEARTNSEYLAKMYDKLKSKSVKMTQNDKDAAALGRRYGDTVKLQQELASAAGAEPTLALTAQGGE